MEKITNEHFDRIDFDIRKKYQGFSRFMDQKVTPDVLSFVSDCIINLADSDSFTVRRIWNSDYFVKNTIDFFQKPPPSDDSAHSEYNKFIGQPLKTLAYAKVIHENLISNTNHYTIVNKELLKQIAWNERHAYYFLYRYVEKVMTDSEFIDHLIEYKSKNLMGAESVDFYELKERFRKFMRGHTNINNKREIDRIFPKILNVFAVCNQIRGSKKGRMSSHVFTYSDLMYNRTNFRDIGKPKNVTRKRSAAKAIADRSNSSNNTYRIEKAKKIIREKYSHSEVYDQGASSRATQVHHIFPKHEWPQYADYLENLIKLTPEQHFNKAHPDSHTEMVDKHYQIQCLISKCNSIIESIESGELLYSKENFMEMLNDCLNLDLDFNSSFEVIKVKLALVY